MTVRLQERQRDWVVYSGIDAVALQIALQRIAPSVTDTDHVQVIDRLDVGALGRRDHAGLTERFLIPSRVGAPLVGPVVQMAQLDGENGRLQAVEAAVDSFETVVV